MKTTILRVLAGLGIFVLPFSGFGQDIDALRKRAEQGDAQAQCNLGVHYYGGHVIPQDYAEAVKWYRLAAEQKDENAQHNLGVCYAKGHGVPRDYVMAYVWLNIAAASGDAKSRAYRDSVMAKMTPAQIEEGQRLSRDYVKFIK